MPRANCRVKVIPWSTLVVSAQRAGGSDFAMGGAEDWVPSLMMAVAVCEQLEALADGSSKSSAPALAVTALSLRLLATDELERTLRGLDVTSD